jgi:ABC-type antimicrobial peptide transport system permease subunit
MSGNKLVFPFIRVAVKLFFLSMVAFMLLLREPASSVKWMPILMNFYIEWCVCVCVCVLEGQ